MSCLKFLPAAIALLASVDAADSSKKEARVTQIIRDVKLLPSEKAPRPAVVNDRVAEDTGVRTGGDSRSELTFADLTITRLGANTIFSFNKAGRNAQLDSGSMLLRVPKDSGGGAIKTNAVTVAITGTTVIFESTRAGKSKLITLEGGARLSLVKHPRESRYVKAGQMLDVPAGATTLPMPVDIDLDQVMKTNPLITDFGPLPSRDLIAATAQEQHNSSTSSGGFGILPIFDLFGGGPPRRQPTPPPTGPGKNPPGTRPVSEKGPTPASNQPNASLTPTPPPVLTRQAPGQTKTPATTTRTQTTTKSSPSPRKRVLRKTNPNTPR